MRLLVSILFAFALTACGSSDDDGSPQPTPAPVPKEEPKKPETPPPPAPQPTPPVVTEPPPPAAPTTPAPTVEEPADEISDADRLSFNLLNTIRLGDELKDLTPETRTLLLSGECSKPRKYWVDPARTEMVQTCVVSKRFEGEWYYYFSIDLYDNRVISIYRGHVPSDDPTHYQAVPHSSL